MENWELVFGKAENSGIYGIEEDAVPDIRKAAAQAGMAVFCLNLADINGKADFLNAAARTLHFPRHFGSNWDALEDCLTDLSWLDAKGYVLIFQNLDDFDYSAPAELAMVRAILRDVAAYWKQHGVRFFVGFTGEIEE